MTQIVCCVITLCLFALLFSDLTLPELLDLIVHAPLGAKVLLELVFEEPQLSVEVCRGLTACFLAAHEFNVVEHALLHVEGHGRHLAESGVSIALASHLGECDAGRWQPVRISRLVLDILRRRQRLSSTCALMTFLMLLTLPPVALLNEGSLSVLLR